VAGSILWPMYRMLAFIYIISGREILIFVVILQSPGDEQTV